MIIGFLTGRNKELAKHEIKSVLAREFAPSLAFSIVSQSPLMIHTDEWSSRWGQLPAKWLATTQAKTLSNVMLALGGTMRLVDLLADQKEPTSFTVTPETLPGLADFLLEQLNLPPGKTIIGLSASGTMRHATLRALMGLLKNRARQNESSLRVVIPDFQHSMSKTHLSPELTAASVRKNKIMAKGAEIVFIPNESNDEYYIGLTVAIHNPDRDTWLDRGVPKSDALSGMLPPKLARMLVNIGVADGGNCTVLDPFCGNGRVLLEALLMNYPVQGRDVDEIKISSTKTNIAWLRAAGVQKDALPEASVYQHDAREKWRQSWEEPHVVVTEPWLGPPLRERPRDHEARQYASKVKEVLTSSIPHILAERPRRVVMVVPRWQLQPRGELVITQDFFPIFERAGYQASCIATVSRPDSFIARDVILAYQT